MNELIACTPLSMLFPSPIEWPEWSEEEPWPEWSEEAKIGSARWKRGRSGSASPAAARASLARVASVRPSSAASALEDSSPLCPPSPPSLARSTCERSEAQLR